MASDAMGRAGGNVPMRAGGGLSIVVPLFNEAENLAALHSRIIEVAHRLATVERREARASGGMLPRLASADLSCASRRSIPLA